ncbi:MAG: enoyl-CoA hydratase/isomerase family protein [Jatrophihabitantaceae bacterium]
MPAEAGFRAEIAGEVATITLSRPGKRNAQTPHTWSGLTRVASELPGTVRVVVLRGEGPSFSAGLDRAMLGPDGVDGAPGIMALTTMSQQDATERIGAWQRAFDWVSRPGIVSVAAVQGHAIGGGFQLALGADIRILAEDASFVMAEPTLGIVPDLGGTKRLVDLVGYSRAAEICLTGRPVAADEALRIGLASHVVAVDALDDAVERTVAALLAVDRDAATETKALLLAAAGRTQGEQERAEREAQYRRLRALVGLD